jgi:hypothetical protein
MICPICLHLDSDHSEQGCLTPDASGEDFCPCDRTGDEVSWLDALKEGSR